MKRTTLNRQDASGSAITEAAPTVAGRPHPLVADTAREHSEPAGLTPASIRAELSTLLAERVAAYAKQGDDQRSPRVRAIDVYDVARLAVEDVRVARTQQALQEDGDNEGRNEATTRYNARLGQIICNGLPDLFEACAASARAQGRDPKRAVAELSALLATYTAETVRDALKGRR